MPSKWATSWMPCCGENLGVASPAEYADVGVLAGYVYAHGDGVPPQPWLVDRLLRKFAADASTEFVRVAVAQATPLVKQAVARTLALGMAVPLDAVPALRFFERVDGTPPKRGTPEPLTRSTRTALRKLMRRPAYRRSWFFDESDLTGAGIAVPTRARTAPAAWIAEAARRLARVPALHGPRHFPWPRSGALHLATTSRALHYPPRQHSRQGGPTDEFAR